MHEKPVADVNKDLKLRASAIGLKKNVYCHLFRHSYITTMLDSGVDSVDVCEVVLVFNSD